MSKEALFSRFVPPVSVNQVKNGSSVLHSVSHWPLMNWYVSTWPSAKTGSMVYTWPCLALNPIAPSKATPATTKSVMSGLWLGLVASLTGIRLNASSAFSGSVSPPVERVMLMKAFTPSFASASLSVSSALLGIVHAGSQSGSKPMSHALRAASSASMKSW